MNMSAWNFIGPLYCSGLCAMVAVIYQLMPQLTRPEVYFGVTVTSSFRSQPSARAALRGYRRRVWIHTMVAAAIIMLGARFHDRLPLFSVAGVLWLVAGSTHAQLAARRMVLPHATPGTTTREADLTPRPRSLPGGVLAQSGPFAGLLVVGAYLALSGRQLSNALPLLLTGLLLCSLFLFISYNVIHRSKRVRVTGQSSVDEQRFRNTVVTLVLVMEYFTALTLSMLALPSRTPFNPEVGPAWLMLLELPLLIVIMVVLIRLGQGGSRLSPPTDDGAPIGDRTSDSLWKWGLFYSNPDDPALFVEKRFGIGYTLNLANRWSWLVLLMPLLVPFLILLVAR